MEYEIEIYQDENEKQPFIFWLEDLPAKDQQRIRMRLSRAENGNLGDHKSVGEGVYELRFFFSAGYRVYFGFREQTLILLISGGDKSSQNKDIKKAKSIWNSLNS